MLSHRGLPLGITCPKSPEMQTRAIAEGRSRSESAWYRRSLRNHGGPAVGSLKEIQNQADVINITAAKVI